MDAALGRDAIVDPRRRLHAAIQNDRELAPDVLARDLAELATALGGQRKADGRLVVLVERRPRVAQVAARHSGDFAHQVVHGSCGLTRGTARTGNDFHSGRHLPVRHQRFFRRRRPLLDDLQLEKARRSHDLLRALDVCHARELDEDLIAAGALL